MREDIRHPFIPLQQIIYEVELEEKLINKVADELFSRVSKKIEEESYLVVGRSRQVIHPQSDDSTPFQMNIRLGENGHFYDKDFYSLTDWLIDMGGISRSCYIAGMIISHVIASHMQ